MAIYQQVNLYQPIFRRQKQVFSSAAMLQVAGVVAVALATLYLFGLWQVRGLEEELRQVEARELAYSAQLERLDPATSLERRRQIDAELERLNEILLEQAQLLAALEEAPLGSTAGFSRYLAALARRHEPGLWLTEISINGVTEAIELVGRSLSPDRIPAYLLTLGEEEALDGQRFDEFDVLRSSDSPDVVFRVSSRAVFGGLTPEAER